jgi:hypothetical protein
MLNCCSECKEIIALFKMRAEQQCNQLKINMLSPIKKNKKNIENPLQILKSILFLPHTQ